MLCAGQCRVLLTATPCVGTIVIPILDRDRKAQSGMKLAKEHRSKAGVLTQSNDSLRGAGFPEIVGEGLPWHHPHHGSSKVLRT